MEYYEQVATAELADEFIESYGISSRRRPRDPNPLRFASVTSSSEPAAVSLPFSVFALSAIQFGSWLSAIFWDQTPMKSGTAEGSHLKN
jgi:hypothetical protein